MLGQLLSAFFAAYAGMLRLAASEHSTATPQDENASHVG